MARLPIDIRAMLLKSGKEQFLAHGFEKASLRTICKEAGLTTGAFYHLIARRPLPQFTSSTADRSELRFLQVNREGMNCLRMYLPYL